MTFKHKLSRRLALLLGALAVLIVGACADSPTESTGGPTVSGDFDPALALASTTPIGQRVTTGTRWVQVFSTASRSGAVLGSQRPGALGTIVQGPTPVTNSEPYPLWRVNFDAGVDGWALGVYLTAVAGTSPPPTPVASIALAPTTLNLSAGATAQLTATLRDAQGVVLIGRTVGWSSANTAVATVSSTGLVRAIATGTVQVTATSETVSARSSVTVTAPAAAPVATVSVSPGSVSLVTGATSQLAATVRDAQGNPLTGRTVTWTSLNSAIGTVSGAGVVTAVAAGTVLVSATSEGVSGTASVTVSAPVVVPPPPSPAPTGPSGLFWASDFSTASGSASSALLDSGRWSLIGGQGLEVVSATGFGFPTTNVLRVTAMQSSTGFALLRTESLGALADGQSRFYRHYANYTFPDGLEDNQTHPIQDGGAGSQINWAWSIRHNNGGAGYYTAGIKLHTNNPFDLAEWTPPPLRKGVTYRFEHQVERISATQFRLHARIYDAAGTLLYDDDDFRSNYNTTSLASNPVLLFNNAANITGLNAGNNGIGGTPTWPFVYAYQGAFAVCATNWCGAYVAGEGR